MAALSALTWSRVSAMTSCSPPRTVIGTVGADVGQGCGAFDLAGVDDDLAALEEGVEDLTRALTGAHEEAEVGVRGIAEPVDRLELEVGCG